MVIYGYKKVQEDKRLIFLDTTRKRKRVVDQIRRKGQCVAVSDYFSHKNPNRQTRTLNSFWGKRSHQL